MSNLDFQRETLSGKPTRTEREKAAHFVARMIPNPGERAEIIAMLGLDEPEPPKAAERTRIYLRHVSNGGRQAWQ